MGWLDRWDDADTTSGPKDIFWCDVANYGQSFVCDRTQLQRMKNSEIYTKAAELVFNDSEEFSCTAIDFVQHLHYTHARQDYTDIFDPHNDRGETAWYGHCDIPENQLARQLSLLFMAEITKETE